METLVLTGNTFEISKTLEWRDLFSDFCVKTALNLRDLYAHLEAGPVDCVLALDSDIDSLELLDTVRLVNADLPVVFRLCNLTAAAAVRLVRAGAHHCFNSHDLTHHLREAIDSVISESQTRHRAAIKAAEANEGWRRILVGESPAMGVVAETIRLVGPRRCTVLISGETGTGKEMAARALHMASPRSQHPMVAINCSALPHHLLEAELFGHTKGAFTGAINQRIGRFEQANKGTIFLDEIGDMPLELQAKLLRVLQDREIQRLGSSETIKVDVRIIAATNVALEERIKQGKFREDLYYRLNVVPLRMPPLRKRSSDIAALVRHFIQRICTMEGLPLKRVSPEAMTQLRANSWPGNVRQLENSVEMALAISGEREVLYPGDFGLNGELLKLVSQPPTPVIPDMSSEEMSLDTAVTRFELSMLDNALRQCGGNKSAAAERLGIKRTTLIMKIRSFQNSGFQLPCAS